MSNSLLIAGLPFLLTERQLGDMIWPYGTVLSAKIVRLRNGKGHPVALGLVKMSSPVGVRKVSSAFDGNMLNGHHLYVSLRDWGRGSRRHFEEKGGLL
jgi:hypothetical protein